MAFNNNNNFNNSGNNQNGEKKKTNFRIGKIWGADGVLEVSVWCADTGVRSILSIKSAVGKDPSTGANVLEQKMPNELPRFFMDAGLMNAFINGIAATSDLGSVNIVIDKGGNNKLTIVGQSNQIKVTIDHPKCGSRTVTLDSVVINGKPIHANFNILVEYIKIAYKKALVNKLDPEEFGMVANNDNGEDETVPF